MPRRFGGGAERYLMDKLADLAWQRATSGRTRVTEYVLRKNGKYLSDRYTWIIFPVAWQEWQLDGVFAVLSSMGGKVEIGEMVNGNVDAAKWQVLDFGKKIRIMTK